jgi:energy-coupling factor transporter ATP-binding protein EcfA2
MSSITIDKLSKVYDNDVIALQDITLEISSCDFLVIIGPSGCGKTTLLMLIAGLEQCTSGKIFIDGICVNEVEPKNRDIAMVIDKKSLFRRHGHPPAGTGLNERFHGGNVAESGRWRQVRLQTRIERIQGAGKTAGRLQGRTWLPQ